MKEDHETDNKSDDMKKGSSNILVRIYTIIGIRLLSDLDLYGKKRLSKINLILLGFSTQRYIL
jgi:hypothetical protein